MMEKTSAQILCEAETRGAEAARRVIAQFGTDDVYTLARRAGVTITRERWPLVTVGELEKRSRTIRVNLNATECAGNFKPRDKEFLEHAIVAHELGHLFDERAGHSSTDKQTRRLVREHAAHGFAAELLQVSCAQLRGIESHFKKVDGR